MKTNLNSDEREEPTEQQIALAAYLQLPEEEAVHIAFTETRDPHRSRKGGQSIKSINISAPFVLTLRLTDQGFCPARW